MNSKMKARNESLDILKFISAIFVVFIHILFNGQFGIAVKAVANFAVPIFFICSGYFSFNTIVNGDYKKLLKRCIPLLKILFFAVLIFAFCEFVFNGSINFITDLKSIKTYVMLFVFNSFNDGFFIPLWFLPALIYVYLFSALIVKLKLNKLFHFFPFLLLVSILFYDVLLGYMDKTVSHIFVRNFAFSGLPFFSIGYLLGNCKQKNNPLLLGLMILFGIGVTLLECKYIYADAGIYFGTILIAVPLFMIFNSVDIHLNNEKLKFILSKSSLYIYILHIPINSAFWRFGAANNFRGFYPLFIVVLTITISIIISSIMFDITKSRSQK